MTEDARDDIDWEGLKEFLCPEETIKHLKAERDTLRKERDEAEELEEATTEKLKELHKELDTLREQLTEANEINLAIKVKCDEEFRISLQRKNEADTLRERLAKLDELIIKMSEYLIPSGHKYATEAMHLIRKKDQ